MDTTAWIKSHYESNGRDWLHNNYEKMCLDCERPANRESYMRSIRKIVRNTAIPDSPDGVATVTDSIDYHDVDMTSMRVKDVTVNTWGSGTNQNKQVKVKLEPRLPDVNVAEIIEDFRKELSQYKQVDHVIHTRSSLGKELHLEINIPDAHFGLMSWAKETGAADYDIKIAREVYLDSVVNLLALSETYGPTKITLVTGSDFFNSDTLENTTTKGTRQSEDGRFQKSFQVGWHTLRDAIDLCAAVADVEVVVIPGNHDFTKSFYLGEVLSAWYEGSTHVSVDNSPLYYKYKKFGCNLIGYTHGDTLKPSDLPLLMATDVPALWASTTNREWHVGHWHTEAVFEKPGCKVMKIPSIAPASDWTARMGYRSLREAVGYLYDPDYGKIAGFSHRPVIL